MIQIAVISDIHGNLIALNEVLKDIKKRNISQIYCLGDLVDFAPWGNEVISLMKEKGIPCLLGNHDERIAFDLPIVSLPHHGHVETASRELAIKHSKKHITLNNKSWLASLPYNIELTFKLGDSIRRILLVHASLRSNDEYVYESDSKLEMLKQLQIGSIDVLFMGHTHQSFIQKIDNTLFINCGSVGRSKEMDRKASYSVLRLTTGTIKAEIVKIDYNIEHVASEIYASDIPDFYGDFILNLSKKNFNGM